MIYTKDHLPAHVHVVGPGSNAKINLGSLDVMDSNGFSDRDLSRILDFIDQNHQLLLEAWRELHEENN